MNSTRRLITPRRLTAIILACLVGWLVWSAGPTNLSAQLGSEPELESLAEVTAEVAMTHADVDPYAYNYDPAQTLSTQLGSGPEPEPLPRVTVQATMTYADVDSDAYYYDAVRALSAAGVYDGTDCDDNQLCPGQPLKRWEMAVWLIRALGETDPTQAAETRFDDVENDDWWMSYVERMADLEITTGCSDDPPKYCPDRDVNRGQMASLLTRALDLPKAPPAGFADVDQDSVHRDNINRLAAAKITTGCKSEPLQYCPQRSVTRAHMSAFIYRGLQWREQNQPVGADRTAPTPTLIGNDTDAFITEENDFSRYIRDNVVAKYEDRNPWLRDAWNHTNRSDFTYLAAEGYGTAVYYGNRLDKGEALPRSTAIAMTAGPEQVSWGYNPSHVHELAHVYTKSNRIVANPAPIAVGHLYFSEITRGGGYEACRSWTHELYAETAESLIFGPHLNHDRWAICSQIPNQVTDEAIEVVYEAFSGRIPQWFYDTFEDESGDLDYRAIWSAIGRMQSGQSRLAAINQLRYSFGGYCSEADVWKFHRGDLDIDQPWVDGGC